MHNLALSETLGRFSEFYRESNYQEAFSLIFSDKRKTFRQQFEVSESLRSFYHWAYNMCFGSINSIGFRYRYCIKMLLQDSSLFFLRPLVFKMIEDAQSVYQMGLWSLDHKNNLASLRQKNAFIRYFTHQSEDLAPPFPYLEKIDPHDVENREFDWNLVWCGHCNKDVRKDDFSVFVFFNKMYLFKAIANGYISGFCEKELYVLLDDDLVIQKKMQRLFFCQGICHRIYSEILPEKDCEDSLMKYLKVPFEEGSFSSICQDLSLNGLSSLYKYEKSYHKGHYLLGLQQDLLFKMKHCKYQISSDLKNIFFKAVKLDLKRYLKTFSIGWTKPVLGNSLIKIVHCIPNFFDSVCHAPSLRLYQLLERYDRKIFEPSVMISLGDFLGHEELSQSFFYPCVTQRLQQQLDLLKIPLIDVRENSSLLKKGQLLARHLNALNPQIVIFHEAFPINEILINSSHAFLKIFMEHGDVSLSSCLDGWIVGHEEQKLRWKECYSIPEDKIWVNPKVVDVTSYWSEHMPSKQDLGLSSDDKVLYTISNHLDERMSYKMWNCIDEILEAVPQAHFFAIGNEKGIRAKINILKNHHRIHCLGVRSDAKNLLRIGDLYLNEFPIGSDCAVYEAMKAGCPVITMEGDGYDDAAFAGADYLGKDLAVKLGSYSEYTNTAVQILTNPQLSSLWRYEMIRRSSLRGSIEEYSLRHQEILFQIFETKLDRDSIYSAKL